MQLIALVPQVIQIGRWQNQPACAYVQLSDCCVSCVIADSFEALQRLYRGFTVKLREVESVLIAAKHPTAFDRIHANAARCLGYGDESCRSL